jgi:acetyl esterase/lipase
MFSTDGGRTWGSHHAISDKTGFNYSGIVEVQPGRLLYLHDGGGLQAMYIDVERTREDSATSPTAPTSETAAPPAKKPTTDYALRTAKELKPDRKLVYKTAGERKLELHLFDPQNAHPGEKRPCFLAIHGGGWVAGTPDVVYCVAKHFADRGWLGVSLQYRIARKDRNNTVFDAVQDARSAMRYLRTHADELGIDPNRIVAGGRSAGGHLAAAAALFDGIDEPGEDTRISCVPNALALYSAVLDTSEQGYGNAVIGERWRELSPLLHVRAGLPPTLVLHGLRDTIAPTAGAQAFTDAMKKAGNRCELILNQRGSHSYMMRTEALFTEAMQQTEEFLRAAGIIPEEPTEKK